MIYELNTYKFECDRCGATVILMSHRNINYVIENQSPKSWIVKRYPESDYIHLYCSEACKNAVP